MVAPGFLQNALVRQWLGGVEPAWTLLTVDSFNGLRRERLSPGGPLMVSENLGVTEMAGSFMIQNSVLLLEHARDGGGLKLTAAGNLTRAVVSEMILEMTWPAYEKADLYRFNKVINEPDFLPLHAVRIFAQGSRLLRASRGKLVTTKLGRSLLSPERPGALFAVLFRHTLSTQALTHFDRAFPGAWPQCDIGIMLWALSVSADTWQTPERLARLCTVPVNGVIEAQWDVGAAALEANILLPLLWFGLLDYRREEIAGTRFGQNHFYRKTSLFNRALQFNVNTEIPVGLIQ